MKILNFSFSKIQLSIYLFGTIFHVVFIEKRTTMLHIKQSLDFTLTHEMLEETEFDQLLKMIGTATAPINAYHYAIKASELATFNNNENQIAIIELLLVDILIKNGAYQEALYKNIQTIGFFQKTGRLTREAKGWRYLAIIHRFLGDHGKQLEYNKRSLSIIQKLNNPLEEIQLLNNIGDTYLNMGLYEKAEEIFESNLENPQSDELMVILSTKNLGKVYFKKKEFQKAKLIFKKVAILAEENNLPEYSLASDHFLGRIFLIEENYQLACKYLERAAKQFEDLDILNKERKETLENLVQPLILLGKKEKSSLYFKKYIQVNKRISEKRQNQSIRNIQFKLEINEIAQSRIVLEKQNKNLQEANEKIKSQREALLVQSKALKSANQELTQFAYIVSHDIKQPVRTINNFSKLLAREVKDHLSNDAIEFIDIIDSSTKRITAFVEDILKYATATEESKIELEKVNCNEVLNQIKLNLEFQLKESEGQLLFGNLPNLEAHRSLMLQVFQNIISNGLKFRRDEVAPIVRVSGKETEEKYYFEIADNGIGIKEENQASVFKIFNQLNNKSKFEGSGIGLNTVLKILKKYNGSIDLESTFGEGTTFKITIPKVISEN